MRISCLLAAGLPDWGWALLVVGLIVVIPLVVFAAIKFAKKAKKEPEPVAPKERAPKAPRANKTPAQHLASVPIEPAAPKEEPAQKQEVPADKPVQKQAEPAPAAEAEREVLLKVPSEQPAQNQKAAEPIPEGAVVVAPKAFESLRLLRSFQAKLMQSDAETKARYSAIKNELTAYGLKGRIGWHGESFRVGRDAGVRLVFRGKTLAVLFALDPAKYADTKYKVEDVSDAPRFEKTPCMYRISNERRLRYSFDLIAAVCEGKEKGESNVDFAAQFPYERDEVLIRRKLIRVVAGKGQEVPEIRTEVKAEEVSSLLDDSYAKAHVEESVRYADRTRRAIVNVDDLSRTFADGDTVTIEDIRTRVAGVDKRATYFKVLARGTLDKALTVEADDFSVDAVKMILLTGGKVIKTKEKRA